MLIGLQPKTQRKVSKVWDKEPRTSLKHSGCWSSHISCRTPLRSQLSTQLTLSEHTAQFHTSARLFPHPEAPLSHSGNQSSSQHCSNILQGISPGLPLGDQSSSSRFLLPWPPLLPVSPGLVLPATPPPTFCSCHKKRQMPSACLLNEGLQEEVPHDWLSLVPGKCSSSRMLSMPSHASHEARSPSMPSQRCCGLHCQKGRNRV